MGVWGNMIIKMKEVYFMKYDLENINARFGIGSQKWQEMKNNPLVDEKVIPFSVADMEFKLAPEITEGLKTFIDDNILGYAGTNKKYRESVCKWQQQNQQVKQVL